MKILHIFANYKWTGPADAALSLARSLQEKHKVVFMCGGSPHGQRNQVKENAHEFGVPVIVNNALRKHLEPLTAFHAMRFTTQILRHDKADIVHTHLTNDHLVTTAALWRLQSKIPLVRSYYEDSLTRSDRVRNKILMRCCTNATLVFSRGAAEELLKLGMRDRRIHVIDPAVDVHRFNPARNLPDMRAKFCFGVDDFVIGIVARVQRHREFDVVLDAIRRVRHIVPNLRVLVVGRGTHINEVLIKPSRAMGLSDIVKSVGYLDGDSYIGALEAMSAKLFMVPGSDGTCRAVREAMAMGKPVIATRRGILPEMVGDGVEGIIIDPDPKSLADTLVRLAGSPDLVKTLGENALKKAHERFSLERQAGNTEKLYQEILQVSSLKSKNRAK
ncbi:MAG: glycosyltransferase family 4 protein [Thermodesulfobacteriota bacterium]|nr:glycosyltransferase family 4 protein [Thermodesulfobacteriota bacterium]